MALADKSKCEVDTGSGIEKIKNSKESVKPIF